MNLVRACWGRGGRATAAAACITLSACGGDGAQPSNELAISDRADGIALDILLATVDVESSDARATADQVDRFIEIGETSDDATLRVFHLSEEQFRTLHEDVRSTYGRYYVHVSEALRVLAYSAAELAVEVHERGDSTKSQRILEVIERFSEANQGAPSEIVLIGDITAEAIARRLASVRASLQDPDLEDEADGAGPE